MPRTVISAGRPADHAVTHPAALAAGQGRIGSVRTTNCRPKPQTILIAAEKAFWRAVKTGETPVLFDCEPPKPRIEAVCVVDMNASNSWAEFAALFCETREAHADHERAKSELKGLMPEDAKEAMGHGIRAKRSKSGAVSFDLVEMEVGHASVQ
jgi:hypothetical protein